MTRNSALSEVRKLLFHPVSLVGIVAVAVLTITLILIFDLAGITNSTDQTSISLVGIVINGLLTVFLLTIYAEMRATQEEQRDTEEAQKELQEQIVGLQRSLTSMESEPQIVMEQLEVSPSENEDMIVTLSNVGRGFAKDLQIAIDAEVYRGTDVDVEFDTYRESLRRKRDSAGLVGGGDYLMPNEDAVEFEFSARVEIGYKDLGPNNPVYPTYKINQIPEALLTQDIHSGDISPEELGYEREGLSSGFWSTQDAIDNYDIQLVVMKLRVDYNVVDEQHRTEELTEYIVPVCADLATKDALKEGMPRGEYEWGLNNKGDYFSSFDGYDRSLAQEKGPAETRTPPDI